MLDERASVTCPGKKCYYLGGRGWLKAGSVFRHKFFLPSFADILWNKYIMKGRRQYSAVLLKGSAANIV